MKALRILLFTVLCVNGAALAQAPGAAEPNGQGYGPLAVLERVRQIASDMNLPADEKTKVDAVLDQSRQDALEIRGQMQDMTPQERMEKVRDFLSDVKQKVEAELTDGQKEEFEKKFQESRPQGAVGAGAVVERFRANLQSLNLTDEQKQKTDEILKDTGEKLKDVASEQDAGARQTKYRDAMQEMRQRLSEVLSPDQLQALREKMQQNAAAPATRPARVAAVTPAPTTRPAAMAEQAAAAQEPKRLLQKRGPAR